MFAAGCLPACLAWWHCCSAMPACSEPQRPIWLGDPSISVVYAGEMRGFWKGDDVSLWHGDIGIDAARPPRADRRAAVVIVWIHAPSAVHCSAPAHLRAAGCHAVCGPRRSLARPAGRQARTAGPLSAPSLGATVPPVDSPPCGLCALSAVMRLGFTVVPRPRPAPPCRITCQGREACAMPHALSISAAWESVKRACVPSHYWERKRSFMFFFLLFFSRFPKMKCFFFISRSDLFICKNKIEIQNV